MPTRYWPAGNIELLERYRDWLLGGGVNERVTNLYHIIMAGHVFGLTLKPYRQLDPDTNLDCALEYVRAKGLSASWISFSLSVSTELVASSSTRIRGL